MVRKLRYGRFSLLVTLILAAVLLVAPGLAPAVDEDPLDIYMKQQREAVESMRQIEKDIAAGKTKKTQYEQEIANLDAQQVVLSQQISSAKSAIGTLNALIDEAAIAIAEATARLNERQEYLESRLRDIYVNGDITMLDVFFSAASFDEFLMLYDDVERIMTQDKMVLDDILAERTLIEEEKARLQKHKDDQEFILAEMETNNKALENLQKQKSQAANELSMTIEQLAAKYEEEEAASAAAEAMIRQIMASRAKTAYYGGVFIWPLPGNYTNITSDYGMRNHPILKKNLMHAGIDLGAPNGTPIYAVGAGEVIHNGWLGGYGNCVMIDHGGDIVTLYGHMSERGAYQKGDTVVAGNVIGLVGSTGQSTGNHLHFEVRKDGAHTDPHPYLGR